MPGMAIDSPAVDGLVRCAWPGADPLNLEHHDLE